MSRKHVEKQYGNNRSSFYETSKILKLLKKSKISNLDEFSIWEKKILQSLRKNGISLETKFRNFPLKVEDQKYEYIPDFLVKVKTASNQIETWVVEIKPYAQTREPKKSKRLTKRYIKSCVHF